jgi:uncharacterized protein with HEPN domain
LSERDLVYLDSLVDAADAIRDFIGSRTKEEFFAQRLVRDAVLRNLEVLGEAAGRVSAELQLAHPKVEWKKASGMRNHLAHGYLTLNMNLIWDTVKSDVPSIGEQVRAIRSKLEDGK